MPAPRAEVRAKLELSLTASGRDKESEPTVSAIEDMDRLAEFLDKSVDVADAKANALRLNRVAIDLDDLLRVTIDLYEPVEDNGPGFEPEVRSQIFERRVKGRNSTGHGLGLAFVEAVVRAHGGTVEASNRYEGGVRLTISLPLAVDSSSAFSPIMAHASG
jgi:signal transduction histidine kinase